MRALHISRRSLAFPHTPPQSFWPTWARLCRAAQPGKARHTTCKPCAATLTRCQAVCGRQSVHSCWRKRQNYAGPKHFHGGDARDRFHSSPRNLPVRVRSGIWLCSNNSEAVLWSFSTSWEEAAAQPTAAPSPSQWCRLAASFVCVAMPPLTLGCSETAESQQVCRAHQHSLPQLGRGDPAVPGHAHAHVGHRRRGQCQRYFPVQACGRLQVQELIRRHVSSSPPPPPAQRPILWSPLRRCSWAATVRHHRSVPHYMLATLHHAEFQHVSVVCRRAQAPGAAAERHCTRHNDHCRRYSPSNIRGKGYRPVTEGWHTFPFRHPSRPHVFVCCSFRSMCAGWPRWALAATGGTSLFERNESMHLMNTRHYLMNIII